MSGLDPVFPHMCAALLAIVFLGGAWQKMRDPDGFFMAIEQYRLLPAAWSAPAGRGLLLLESAAGLLLLPLATRPFGAALALVVLVIVSAAVAINLLRGRREIDCGCGGPEGGQHLSWGLVLRNLLLLLAASMATVTDAGAGIVRDLVWLDRLTLVAGTLALYGLYAAANQLLANQPRLLKLRG